jgi:C1A family cysteine protease
VSTSAQRLVSGKKPIARTPKRQKGLGGYGWVPDIPDARDYLYGAPSETLGSLPPSVNLQSKCPPVYNQLTLGSCTANAIAAAVEYIQKHRFTPSRLFIYYFERVIEGTIDSDSGAQLRDGIKAVSTVGVCPETIWPYHIADFKEEPNAKAYGSAGKTKATVYSRVAQDLTQMKGCLAEGFPFVFGFTAYAYFESSAVAKTGIVRLPTTNDKTIGGHAVMAVGYDDKSQTFRIRNSWGASWGLRGYFTMPYSYLMSPRLASDFWTIRNAS